MLLTLFPIYGSLFFQFLQQPLLLPVKYPKQHDLHHKREYGSRNSDCN